MNWTTLGVLLAAWKATPEEKLAVFVMTPIGKFIAWTIVLSIWAAYAIGDVVWPIYWLTLSPNNANAKLMPVMMIMWGLFNACCLGMWAQQQANKKAAKEENDRLLKMCDESFAKYDK